ncbi:TSUP family transporter [Amycolatopsis solani]|uniref:TSUP family transporter n=1 Tax=Amycolatopsis solani TaxID=3028615 RepID=UPI00339D4C49
MLATLTTGSGAFNLWVRPRGTSAARVGEVPAADFGRPGSGLGSPPSAPSAESGPPSRASAAEPAPPSPQPGPTPPADPEPPQASEAGPGLLTAEPGLPPSALSAEPEPSAAPSAESGPPGRAPSAEPSPPRRASVAEPGSPSPAPLPPAPVAEPSPPRRASAAEPGSPSPAPSAAPEPSAAESAWPGQAPPPPSPHDPGRRQGLPPAAAVAVGVFVGFGSALTGTGGPVLLVPVLLALGVPALTTVAAGQLVQLPLVGFATLGYAAHGSVHFGLGSLLGVLSAAGVLAGARWARKLPGRHLHRVASGALVGFGGVLFALPFL